MAHNRIIKYAGLIKLCVDLLTGKIKLQALCNAGVAGNTNFN